MKKKNLQKYTRLENDIWYTRWKWRIIEERKKSNILPRWFEWCVFEHERKSFHDIASGKDKNGHVSLIDIFRFEMILWFFPAVKLEKNFSYHTSKIIPFAYYLFSEQNYFQQHPQCQKYNFPRLKELLFSVIWEILSYFYIVNFNWTIEIRIFVLFFIST